MQRGSPGQGRGSPKVIRTLWGRSDGSAGRRQALPEEISFLVRSHRTTAAAMQRDRGGEVSRGHSSHDGRRAESSNAGSRLRVSMTDYGRKQRYSVRNLRGPRRGGEAEPTCRVRGGTFQFTASHQKRVLASRGASPFEETAVYIKVRTVVWEDGVARPLLPDSWTRSRSGAY